MRSVVGILLVLLGGLIVLVGIGVAVWPLVETYQANLNDALGDTATVAETNLQGKMLRGVYVAIPGLILIVIGKVLLKRALIRALRAK